MTVKKSSKVKAIANKGWTLLTASLRWLGKVSPTLLLLAVIVIVIAFTVRSCDTNRAAKVENQVLTKSISAASRAETGTQRAKARITQKEDIGYARTEAAIAAEPDWADQPVPAGVLASLSDD